MTCPVTVATISRIYVGELPYINAFIDHYLNIGVSKIYLVITNVEEEQEIKQYLAPKSANIEFINSILAPNDSITMDSMNYTLKTIKETYLLHIDIDEFLDIPKKISDIVTTINKDKIHFNWAITVYDKISDTTNGARGMTHRNKPYKTLCKTSLIKNFTSNGHDFETNEPTEEVICDYNLVHYWGRSFNDILIKVIYGNKFKNIKSGNLEELIDTVNIGKNTNIPVRLKMLAMLSRLDKSVPLPNDYIKEKIDHEKEQELLLTNISVDQREIIYDRYKKFRADFDIEKYKILYYKTGLQGGIDWKNI